MKIMKLNRRSYTILRKVDPFLHNLILKEERHRKWSIDLVSSNSLCDMSILQTAGCSLQGSYSGWSTEGAYYGGTNVLRDIESLAKARALELFELDPDVWGVNVQPYSGSLANLAAFLCILNANDRIMGLSCNHGGHHTHCSATETSDSCFLSSKLFTTKPFFLNTNNETLDYKKLLKNVENFHPHILVVGSGTYSRLFDYKIINEICKKNNALLHADIAHVCGLIAAKVVPSPFKYADIVTATTHKTLKSARGGIIFYRKKLHTRSGLIEDMDERMNLTVNCMLQGCPHSNITATTALALKLASTEEFKQYQKKVIVNASYMCSLMQNLNYRIVSGGTQTHHFVVDMGFPAGHIQSYLEQVGIFVNTCSVPRYGFDGNNFGIRIGSPVITARKFSSKDVTTTVSLLSEALDLFKKSSPVKLTELTVMKNKIRMFLRNGDF